MSEFVSFCSRFLFVLPFIDLLTLIQPHLKNFIGLLDAAVPLLSESVSSLAIGYGKVHCLGLPPFRSVLVLQ